MAASRGGVPTMIAVTGVAQEQAWREGVLPPVERVRPGLWSIPVPIPLSPLRYVLVYSFELPDGLAIVDAGWDTSEAWTALRAGVAGIGAKVDDVRAVLVTHVHPDHYGLAGRVRAESGAWIGLHPLEARTLRARYLDVGQLVEVVRGWLVRCGVPLGDAAELSGSSTLLMPYVQLAQPDRLIEHQEPIGLTGWDLSALWTPGHTPGHLCFYERRHRLLLSGDHVLPRISPNISAHPQQSPDPLGDYLMTFAELGRLGVDEVLPAHEYRFSGLATRLGRLREHHEARLAELLALVRADPGATTWPLTQQLSWSRPWPQVQGFMRRAAVGEALAHLALLERRGLVRSAGEVVRWWPV